VKKILFRAFKSPLDRVTPEMVLQQRIWSPNFGNFVFSDSAFKMLTTESQELSLISETVLFREKAADLAARINDECDAAVLPFANSFRGSYRNSLDKWTDLISRLRIPVTVFGIGAQSTLDYEFEPLRSMDDSVRKFTAAVLDRSPSIGVRGQFTHDYLKHLGFSDVEVIGCPSMFRFGDKLKVEKAAPTLDRDARIAVSYTETPVGDMGAVFQANYERYPNLHFIAQDQRELELMYFGDTSEPAGTRATGPRYGSHPAFSENRVRLFPDPITWINTLGQYDFTFGTRIHGNITSLLGGTPSVVLYHDSRTRELSEYFDIPRRRITDLSPDVDAAKLYEEADYSALVDGHRERFERIKGFLARHGVDHVYTETGDQGAAFEKRLAEVDLPAPVETLPDSAGEAGFRTAWLYANTKATKQKQAAAAKRLSALEQQVAELSATADRLRADLRTTQQRVANSPVRRAARVLRGGTRRLSR
jgi:hypothetical protein